MSWPISSVYSLQHVTQEQLMEMTQRDLLSSARYSRRYVNSALKKLQDNGLDFALADLGFDDLHPQARPIPSNATPDQLRQIIFENSVFANDTGRYMSNAKATQEEWENMFNQFSGEGYIGPQGMSIADERSLFRESISNKSWVEAAVKLDFDSNDAYEIIISGEASSMQEMFRILFNRAFDNAGEMNAYGRPYTRRGIVYRE